MNVLCDVHISFKIVKFLKTEGINVRHVNELPDKWYTKDSDISRFCDEHNYVILTKDKDFKDSFLLSKTPKKVIKINLGNISNELLIEILAENLSGIKKVFSKPAFFVEIGESVILFHD